MSIKIYINGEKTIIPKFSELTTKEYCGIVSKNIDYDIISYINAFTNKDILKYEVKSDYDLIKISPLILDEDFDFAKQPIPNIIEYKGEKHLINELDDGTYGKRHLFSEYKYQMEQNKFSITELCIYALALFIVDELDTKKIKKCYDELLNMPWIKVLPAGFFLSKKLILKKNHIMRYLKGSIINLNYLGKVIRHKLKHKKIHTIFY